MQQPPNNNPYTSPYAPPPPPVAPPPPQKPMPHQRFIGWYRRQSRPMQIIVALVLVGAVIFIGSAVVVGGIQGAQQGLATPTAATQGSQPTQASQATTAPTSAPTQAPTKPPAPAYPPKTRADLRALAALGDASQIHAFHSESVGLTGVCPQPKTLVTVDPSIKGKQLAEDLLAYWYSTGLENPCGAVVFAFHKQSEGSGDNGYTAGRVILKTADANGSVNLNPNATGLTYTLTLDTGDWQTAPDYTVTWQQ